MNESKAMKTESAEGAKSRSESERYIRPPVDIYEDAEGITLLADLPGVSRDRLNIQVEGNTLSIDGQVAIDMPESVEALHADVRVTRYHREFTLSRELESDRIKAQMNDGVLALKLPKRAELQPRKIEVSTR
jgi:HSP20 family molecular chaperone IbpA